MSTAYIREIVNTVDNEFSADSRDKEGKRVVLFDPRRTLEVFLSPAHILQVEAVRDAKDGTDRGIVTMTSGLRYITARAAAIVCGDLAKMG